MGHLPRLALDDHERAWVLDMHRRNTPRIRKAAVVLGVLLAACYPWFDRWSLVPMLLAGACILVGDLISERTQRIEGFVAGWFLLQLFIVVAIVVNGNQHAGDLALLVFPVLGACAGFPQRLVWACAAYTLVLMAGAALLFGAQPVLDDPSRLLIPVALLIASVIITTGVRESSIEHREAAVIDGLTGMLNRSALHSRALELEHQAQLNGEQVGVVVADLDHFKDVNDTHGHAAGDQVLQETAYRIRKELRAFDLAYRLGGEEFVLLLPGATVEQAHLLGERLRSAIGATPMAGDIAVTASFGVAASSADRPFVFDEVFAAADAALYEAKRDGRDRVEVAARLTAA